MYINTVGSLSDCEGFVASQTHAKLIERPTRPENMVAPTSTAVVFRSKRILPHGDGWQQFQFPDGNRFEENDHEYVRQLFGLLFRNDAVRYDGERLWGRVFVFCAECTTRMEIVEEGFVASSPFPDDGQRWSRSLCVTTTCGHCERGKGPTWTGMVGCTLGIDLITDRGVFREVVEACQNEGVERVEVVRRVVDRRALGAAYGWPLYERFISTQRGGGGKMELRSERHLHGWL